jgi:hypothetical protein
MKLGDRVLVHATLYRDGVGDDPWARVWRRTDVAKPVEGIVTGKRTLSNGRVEEVREWNGYYGSVAVDRQWHPTEHFQAYHVVTDLRCTHIVVPEDGLTLLEDS